MAIQKNVLTEFNTEFKYHKIVEVNILSNDNGIQLRIVTDSYLDKESRQKGARAIRMENIISGADFAFSPFYNLLKAKFPMFADGDDDFEDSWKGVEKPEVMYTQQTPRGELINQWKENEREEQ